MKLAENLNVMLSVSVNYRGLVLMDTLSQDILALLDGKGLSLEDSIIDLPDVKGNT